MDTKSINNTITLHLTLASSRELRLEVVRIIQRARRKKVSSK